LFKKYRSAKTTRRPICQNWSKTFDHGFYRNKAKSIQKCCQELVGRFESEVPKTLEEMVTCPASEGRRPMSSSECLRNSWIVVDTMCIGEPKDWTHQEKRSGQDRIRPHGDRAKEEWTHFSNLLIWHGRRTCVARKPLCDSCAIRKLCDYGQASQEIADLNEIPHE